MAKERFLILGASSFYGAYFAVHVKRQGDDVIIPSHRWRLGEVERGENGNEIEDSMQKHAPHYVVNFASRSMVEESWGDPSRWLQTNGCATVETMEYLRAFRGFKFIHVSTPESYGHTDTWVNETYSTWKPSTPYAVSRAAADMMLMAYHRAYGFPAIITRTANIYGPGQQAHRIVPLAFTALRSGATMNLHAGGDTVRSFIHVKDACAATYLLAKQGVPGETYHISTRRKVSIRELVEMIGIPPARIGTQPERLGKDKAYLLASDKVRALGWTDTITLEEGLKEYGQTR